MSLDRAQLLAAFATAVASCDPEARVRASLEAEELAAGRRRLGIAVGKAAIAMARGAGAVADGVAIVPAGARGEVPAGWRVIESAHPFVDERSIAAASTRALSSTLHARATS